MNTLGMLKKDEKWKDGKTPTWLYETLRSLLDQQKATEAGFGAIIRGETPDGSGNPILDLNKYFYKPGLPGNQIAYGGTAASGSLTLGSTANAAKGKIYFGTVAVLDEGNVRLGIGLTDPTAALHVRHAASTATLYKPISNIGVQNWTGSGSANFTLIADQSNATFISDGASGGSITNEHLLTAPTGPVSGTHHLYIIAKRDPGSGYSGPSLTLWKGSGHGGVNILNMTPLSGVSTGAFADCGRDLTPTEVAAIEDVRVNNSGLWTLYLTGGSGRETFIADVYISGGSTAQDVARWDGTDGSTQVGRIDAAGQVGIGTGSSTLSGMLHLLTNAVGTPTLWIQLLTAQTADVLRVQNAANSTALAGLTAAGNYYLLSGAGVGNIYTCQSAVTGVGAWGSAAALATRVQYDWRANGPFRVGTDVDGRIKVATGFTITSIYFYRTTAGTSGSTIVDVNKNGVTLFTTQAARPTLAFNGGNVSSTTLPAIVAVAAGDVLSIDIDQIEGGSPKDLVLFIEGA